MNPRILPLLLLSSALTARAATYPQTILADKPAGYWRLGEAAGSTTATNSGSAGAEANGIIFRNVTFGLPGGIKNDADTAVNLDGAQAKIDIPFSPALNTEKFTAEVWAKVSADSSGYRSPLASRNDSPQKGFIFYATPDNQWQFWTGTGVQVGWNTVGGAVAEPEAWAHLVGVYDGTNKLFYVNGVLVGANRSAFTPNEARVLRIGASATESPVGDFFFFGDVDEVAVYPEVLSQERVLAHFTSGSGAAPDGSIPPAVAAQPAGLDRFKGETASFSVLATGSLPLVYQWQRDGVNVPGGTGATLVLTNLQPALGGTYTVMVSNGAGSTTSDPVSLTVADVAKPAITSQPASRTVLPGTPAVFSVAASGSTFFSYQWQLNGQNLTNATNATLSLTNVQAANLGSYKVTVKNAAGSTDSDFVILKFPAVATKSYADTVLADKPAGYWRLGESTGEVADDSAAANDGAYLNGVTLGRPGSLVGDANKAAGFASANKTKLDIPWSDTLNGAVFTVELWAKVTGGTGHRSPLTSRADGPQRGYIFYAEPGNTWQFWTGKGDDTGWNSLPGPAVQPNTYAYLVGKYDGTTMFFYVNGLLVSQGTIPFAPNDASPLRIGAGASEGDGDFFFEGDVDEVAVYNTALTEDQILAHYVAGFPLTTPPAITAQPASQFGLAGSTVRFSVGASGGQPLSYQWRFNGQNISNSATSTLTITNLSSANVGAYSVVVSNAGGSVTSSNATLSIPTRPTRSYLDLVKGDGPVGYWRLDEKGDELVAKDQIAGNNGDILNGVTLGVPGGIAGDTNSAAGFNSADSQKIDVPWTDVLNPPVFSVEVWARVTGGSGVHRSPLTSRADGPQRGYIFYCEPGDTWQFWSGKGDTSGWDNIPGPRAELNKWAHLVATYDGTLKRFYVNGVQVGTSTAAFAPNDASPLRFGGGATEGPGTFFFQGEVDEPAVYNKALTAEQVILHYLAGTPATVTPATIKVARNNNTLVLSWTAGALESAPAVSGPWTAVAGSTSPFNVTPDQSARFYRLRQ